MFAKDQKWAYPISRTESLLMQLVDLYYNANKDPKTPISLLPRPWDKEATTPQLDYNTLTPEKLQEMKAGFKHKYRTAEEEAALNNKE